MPVKKKRETTWYKSKKLHRITIDIPNKHWRFLRKKSSPTSVQKYLAGLIEQQFVLHTLRGDNK